MRVVRLTRIASGGKAAEREPDDEEDRSDFSMLACLLLSVAVCTRPAGEPQASQLTPTVPNDLGGGGGGY